MMKFISPVTQTVICPTRVLQFVATVSTSVPPDAQSACIAAGCVADGTELAGDAAIAQAAEVAATYVAACAAVAANKLEQGDSETGEVNAVPSAAPGSLITQG